MPQDSNQLLRALERIKDTFDSTEVTQRKMRLLKQLSRRRQKSAAAVLRLHEVLCFLRAYPDSRALLKQVEAMLQADLERCEAVERAHFDEKALPFRVAARIARLASPLL